MAIEFNDRRNNQLVALSSGDKAVALGGDLNALVAPSDGDWSSISDIGYVTSAANRTRGESAGDVKINKRLKKVTMAQNAHFDAEHGGVGPYASCTTCKTLEDKRRKSINAYRGSQKSQGMR